MSVSVGVEAYILSLLQLSDGVNLQGQTSELTITL